MNAGRLTQLVGIGLLLAACSHQAPSISTESQAAETIAASPALNSAIGEYRVGDIDVGLLKVVKLSGREIGLQFVIHSSAPLGTCCDILPHVALANDSRGPEEGHFGQVFVVLDMSALSSNGTVAMILIRGGKDVARLGTFLVDLKSLHVQGIAW